MRNPYDVNKCREAAERLFGRAFTSFRELHGGNTSQNFVASIGDEHWFVKVGRRPRIALTVSRHQAVRTPLVPRIAMDGRIGECEDRAVCAEEWFSDMSHVDPADLTTEQAQDLVRSYRAFSVAVQDVKDARDDRSYQGFDAGEGVSVIHGDLNFRNVGFRNGRVMAILDLESVRLGFPAEDLLEFVIHEMERTRLWFRRRLRKLELVLAMIIRASGYSQKAWLAAFGVYVADKRARRLSKARFPLFKKIEHWLRKPLYVRVRHLIEQEAEPC